MNEADKPECWPFPCVRYTVNGRCTHTAEPAQPGTPPTGFPGVAPRPRGFTPSVVIYDDVELSGFPEPQPMGDVPTKAYVDEQQPFRVGCGCEWASLVDYMRLGEKTRSCTDNAEAEERRRRDGPAPTATPTASGTPEPHEHTAACCHHGYCDCGNDCQAVRHPGMAVNTWPCIDEEVEHEGPQCRCRVVHSPTPLSPAQVWCQVRGCDWTASGRNGDLIDALTRHLGDKHVTTKKERGVFAAVKRWIRGGPFYAGR